MSQMENNHPYILELSVTIESRTLQFAASIADAGEALEARMDEIKEHLIATAHLPKEGEPGHEHLIFNFDTRPAMGYEVQGTASLLPTIPTLENADECSCDHAEEDE